MPPRCTPRILGGSGAEPETHRLRQSRAEAATKIASEIAELTAQQALAHTPTERGRKIVAKYFADRDLAFVKLYAQKLVAAEANVDCTGGRRAGNSRTGLRAVSWSGTFDAGQS